MLWWLIGAWLASGTLLPAFLLLRMGYRWLAAVKISPKGLHALSGLVGFGIGVLVLWFVCSFRDSGIAMRATPSASAVAQAPMTHPEVAEAKPAEVDIEAGAVRLAEADATIQPGSDALGQSAGDNGGHQTDAAVPQALLAAPPHLGMKRGLTHRAAHRLSVGPYITHSSSSGVWLFAPNGNEGANN